MFTVVNHLRLSAPLPPSACEAVGASFTGMRDLGCRTFQIVKVADDHVIDVLVLDSAEAAAAVSEEYGGPWMREHVVPLLASPTERSTGEAICSVGF